MSFWWETHSIDANHGSSPVASAEQNAAYHAELIEYQGVMIQYHANVQQLLQRLGRVPPTMQLAPLPPSAPLGHVATSYSFQVVPSFEPILPQAGSATVSTPATEAIYYNELVEYHGFMLQYYTSVQELLQHVGQLPPFLPLAPLPPRPPMGHVPPVYSLLPIPEELLTP